LETYLTAVPASAYLNTSQVPETSGMTLEEINYICEFTTEYSTIDLIVQSDPRQLVSQRGSMHPTKSAKYFHTFSTTIFSDSSFAAGSARQSQPICTGGTSRRLRDNRRQKKGKRLQRTRIGRRVRSRPEVLSELKGGARQK
jgi:hypothetical protein